MFEIEINQRDFELFVFFFDVRGMIKFDRIVFKKIVIILVFKVRKEIVSKLMRFFKRAVLQRLGIKRVIEDLEDEESRLIMLDFYKMFINDFFEKVELDILRQFNVNLQIFKYNLELIYENFKLEEILRVVFFEG